MLAGPPTVLPVALPAAFAGYRAIELESDPRNEIAEAWSEVVLSLAILATFCGLVLALVYGTIGRALRPLRDLSAGFSRVGDGDYLPRVLERGPLELARLCAGFNQMVARLAEMEVRNARLAEHLASVQEEERSDIARDLHDEIGPLLFAINVDLASIRRHQELGAHAAIAPRVEAIRETVGQMQQHVRSLLGRLRPPTLIDLGPAQAVENLVAFWRTRYPGVAFHVDVPPDSFDPATDESIYRIIQESLSNALRHGEPQHIAIAVQPMADGFIGVEVSDDGVGLHGPGGSGFGLLGMGERVQSLGGGLSVRNRVDGSGVVVSARLPYRIGDRLGSDGKAPKVAAE
jgi:two-component system, NarL family, sensor histidine kinase UhpB